MDTLLSRGDHCLDSRGLPVSITGERELLQRALLRLTIKRGAFPRDPALGSELHRLRGARADTLPRLALSYAREALAPMPGVDVESVSVSRSDRDTLDVAVSIAHDGQSYTLEVNT